jgi:uncharacterized protein
MVFSLASGATIINVNTASNFSHSKLIGIRQFDNGSFGGVVADLTVEIRPGSGHVYLDTIPLTKVDTQASARLAKEVACEVLELDCSKLDFLYTMRSPFVILGGPSAGAAFTATTMAALQGTQINNDVFVTGTINPAGSIGYVGGIYEKVVAAKDNGAKIVLVPKGQELVAVPGENKSVNLTIVALQDWNMQVIPVEDITDAYKYLTGFKINRSVVNNEDVASEKLNSALKKMSEGLLPQAEQLYNDSDNLLKTSSVAEKDKIQSFIEQSKTELDTAKKKFDEGSYYSTSSFAVRSMIYSSYAERLVNYYKTKNASYVKSEINIVENDISDFELLFLKNRTMDSVDDVEVIGVVIDRIMESEDTISDAKNAYNQSNFDSALYLTSYAEVRKNTAYQWLILVNEFTGNHTFVFDQTKVKEISLERIEEARNAIVYGQIVSGSALLDEAQTLLQKSETAYNDGKYVFALFEASKSRATSNLALEVSTLSNATVRAKIDELEADSLRSIQKAENLDLTPILALSYLEFAKNFYDSDPAQALIYLSYSKEMAQISEVLTKAVLGDQFMPATTPTVEKYYEQIVRLDVRGSFVEALSLLATGIAAGVLLSIASTEWKTKPKH